MFFHSSYLINLVISNEVFVASYTQSQILGPIVLLSQTIHFMTKSTCYSLFNLKKVQMWKALEWGFQSFTCFFKFSTNTSCIIRSLMPMLNEFSNKASCYSLPTMLLLLHLVKCPTPTQRPLDSTFIQTKMFGVENFVIIITKKWGESNESELQAMMIWEGGQMANMCEGWSQNQNAKHL